MSARRPRGLQRSSCGAVAVLALLAWLAGCDDAARRNPRQGTPSRPSATAAEAPRVHDVLAAPLDAPAPVEIRVPSGRGERYQTARVPGGARRVRLIALDAAGRELARDEGRGALGMPELTGLDGVVRLRVVSLDGRPGALRVYANDARDRDGDGLGGQLEAALGSCDALAQPGCADGVLGDYLRRVAGACRDSDRDGLDDGEELLGVDGEPPLDLPGWGADPRHKDLFIEADYRAALGSVQLDATDLVEVAAFYQAGSAADLKNPDGRPGVALHVDVGFAPQDPAHAALFGAWGGSGPVEERDYHRAASEHLTPNRRGRFRHLLVQASGTGQGKVLGDHFTFNRNYHRVRVFAHELGHTLGLRHHGLDAWGKANCKPNYRSLMNYVYQYEPGVGFATAASVELDPRLLFERDGLGIDDPSFLRAPPFELDTEGRAVDWNRNGLFEVQPVRAAPSWATYKSCGELAHGQTTLAEAGMSGSTPALVASASRLLALWVSSDGALWLRHAASSGPDAQGSCPLGDASDTRCSNWSKPRTLDAPPALRHVAAAPLDGSDVLLALVDADGALFVQRLGLQADAQVSLGAALRVPVPRVLDAAGLVGLNVDASRFGVSRLWSVLFRGPRGQLGEALAASPEGPFLVRELLGGDGRVLRSALAPSALELGTGESCGAFPDDAGFVRVFCYDPRRDAWLDLSAQAFYAGLGPRTTSRVGLGFHRQRAADGSTLDPSEQSGTLVLAFTDDADPHYPNLPWLLLSEVLGPGRSAASSLRLRWQGQLINQWTTLLPGAGVALYEDRSLSALKALVTLATDERPQLQFLPLADGSYGGRLGSGNDFRVIETGICSGLRGRARCQ
jgi:hypothetical protein